MGQTDNGAYSAVRLPALLGICAMVINQNKGQRLTNIPVGSRIGRSRTNFVLKINCILVFLPSEGTCRFGNRCWNSHDLGTIRSNSPININPDQRLIYVSTDDENSEPTLASNNSTAACSSMKSRRREQKPKNANKNSNETKSVWTLTNNITGEKLNGDQDAILLETVKQLNESENSLKTLRQQLRNKTDGDNFSWMEHHIEQSIESDLQCNICYELFIKPTVLNCSHTFCHECIESWTRRVNHCPTCRVFVKSKSHCLTMDTFLDKIAECLPEDIKARRESVKVERINNSRGAESANNRGRNRNSVRRRNNRNSMRRTLGVLWGERDRDGAEWNIALEEALFDPIRLGDVLGRNRNAGDEWDDAMSDSSTDRFYFLG
ncbi:Zinc finger, RING-type,Zinc finger, RING/FYVE/PHD-type,Zinc finger, RING-type, conserved site [Cinara cedri]|uniref:Zinc finger, RING-type,Zinc finger, RING/FYVE/PHD-type,Zinc finger, RING-type, conserved site n=1 Tax=Cinara cedri TaxID=506608 RepID=A0A5E4MPB6_9HEMI|nr:Zinc finger, RING-type,Zinc finger, RING/FYVE/PHD-type,Zinc finger, RING-type, conserved site [Cinara cedri]